MRGPRGGPSENRVRLAPRFRRPLRTFSHPWWLHERELRASACIAAPCRATRDRGGALCRRRCRMPVSQSLNQRWRERPRCPALPVTPGRRDGVVHAIVGRAACRCLRAQLVQDERAARVHVFVSRFAGTNAADESHRNRFARVAMFPGRNVAFCGSRSRRRTIAPFMLAPCSASSMLFASLRPGRWPGLRALTTPPRGTCLALTRWSAQCDRARSRQAS